MTSSLRALTLLVLVASGGHLQAATTILYDDGLGTLPNPQPGLFYFGLGSASQTVVPAGVNLTTSTTAQAGYSNDMPLVLDRSSGIRLNFELTVVSESHTNNHRAGFSVIVLDSEGLGVELGFWSNEIWAQTDVPLHQHGEGVSFATDAGEVAYALDITGSGYALSADGNQILSGALNDYSAFGFPYTLNNYLFLGDNTESAGAEVILGTVSLDTLTTVPLPAPVALLLAGLVGLNRAASRTGCSTR